mmetsp:Transcript_28355/g.41897  ORF Transcript_28355/g.41897 Transcript_28355/m.41897 type:complete len:298 (+) Transcript_28355:128-1021(+)
MPPYGLSRNVNGITPSTHNARPWGGAVAKKVPQTMASRQPGQVPHTRTLNFSTPNNTAQQQQQEQPRAVHVTSQQTPQPAPAVHYWERRKAAMRQDAKKKKQLEEKKRATPKPPLVVAPEEYKPVARLLSVTEPQKEEKKTPTAKPMYGNNGQKHVSHWKQTQNQNAQPAKKTRTPSKSVKFGDVTINQFERALGDNPCAGGGAPLGMRMKHMSSSKKPISVYEGSKGAKKTSDQMRIPLASRRSILMEARTPVDEWTRVEGELQAINTSRIADMNVRKYGSQFEDDERDDSAPFDA